MASHQVHTDSLYFTPSFWGQDHHGGGQCSEAELSAFARTAGGLNTDQSGGTQYRCKFCQQTTVVASYIQDSVDEPVGQLSTDVIQKALPENFVCLLKRGIVFR